MKDTLREKFRVVSNKVAVFCGSPLAFILALLSVVIWACLGPIYKWSEVHMLVINTITTIITYLLVFVIQNTQNRESKEVALKLDEMIRAIKGAKNDFIDLKGLSDDQLKELEEDIRKCINRDKK